MQNTLIDAEALREHLGRPGWAVVDCRFDLADVEAGRQAYGAGHIPGAVYAHLDEDLSGAKTPASGRHPLPAPEALAQRLGRWGIGADTQVVAYDEANGAFAARLWWLLRWLGHPAVAVLDGGFRRWAQLGLPTTSEVPAPAAAAFDPVPREDWLADADAVAAAATQGRPVLDARAPERFRGEVEPIDPVAGHIPGALNVPFSGNLAADGRFLPAADLRRRFEAILDGQRPGEAIAMCGSGVTACHNLLAMCIAGLDGARLYPGSWSGWVSDPARPVAQG